jgi:hypothetical protein
MLSRRNIALAAALILAVPAFILFRPDRLFTDREVMEASPTGGVVARQGMFVSRAHDGKGFAELVTLDDGRRILRLREFATSDGPDLKVFLAADAEATSIDRLREVGYHSLGPIKGNLGDQYYVIPAEVDVAKFTSVIIWCERFGVNFTSAPLAEPMVMVS